MDLENWCSLEKKKRKEERVSEDGGQCGEEAKKRERDKSSCFGGVTCSFHISHYGVEC